MIFEYLLVDLSELVRGRAVVNFVTDCFAQRDEHEAEEDLSEEDRELKENLELLVTRAKDKKQEIAKAALEAIASEIR